MILIANAYFIIVTEKKKKTKSKQYFTVFVLESKTFPIIEGLQNAIRYIVAQLLLVSVMAGKDKTDLHYTLDRCHCCVIMVKFKTSPACFIRISIFIRDYLRE